MYEGKCGSYLRECYDRLTTVDPLLLLLKTMTLDIVKQFWESVES